MADLEFNIPKWTWLLNSPCILLPPLLELSRPGSWAALPYITQAFWLPVLFVSLHLWVVVPGSTLSPLLFPPALFTWLRVMNTPYSPRCPCSCLWLSSPTHLFPIYLLCHSGSRNVAVLFSSFFISFLFKNNKRKLNKIKQKGTRWNCTKQSNKRKTAQKNVQSIEDHSFPHSGIPGKH